MGCLWKKSFYHITNKGRKAGYWLSGLPGGVIVEESCDQIHVLSFLVLRVDSDVVQCTTISLL